MGKKRFLSWNFRDDQQLNSSEQDNQIKFNEINDSQMTLSEVCFSYGFLLRKVFSNRS
jgi:hypothetical protein